MKKYENLELDTELYRYYGNDASLVVYAIVKQTPKGYWIRECWKPFVSDKKHWISKRSIKKRAYLTKEEAYYSYVRRCRSYMINCEMRYKSAIERYGKSKNLREERIHG